MSNGDMIKAIDDIIGDEGKGLSQTAVARLTLAAVGDLGKRVRELADVQSGIHDKIDDLKDTTEKTMNKVSVSMDEIKCNPAIQLGSFIFRHKKASSILGIMLLLLILIPNFELLPIFFKAILTLFGIPIDVVNAASP